MYETTIELVGLYSGKILIMEEEMDLDKVKELIKLIEESDVNEITIEEDGARITVRKGMAGELIQPGTDEAVIEQDQGVVQQARPANWKSISAPMVGTFYRSPSPDANPFVEEGDIIEEGQTVCILEAMKLMNEITAEEKGVIKQVLTTNGGSVEYGQELFLYEPIA